MKYNSGTVRVTWARNYMQSQYVFFVYEVQCDSITFTILFEDTVY